MRPILMTTLTTVLSMIPMVIPGAGGDPSMRGLAYVSMGGLTMATILTLIILPVFYLFICKRDPKDNGSVQIELQTEVQEESQKESQKEEQKEEQKEIKKEEPEETHKEKEVKKEEPKK